MTQLFLRYAEIALPMTLLLAALAVLLPFFQKRYSARLRYFMWVLVALRLLVPVSFTLPRVQAPVTVNVPHVAVYEEITVPAALAETPEIATYIAQHSAPLHRVTALPEVPQTTQTPQNNVTVTTQLTLLDVAALVWASVAVLLLAGQIFRYQVTRRKLLRHARPHPAATQQANAIAKNLGVRRPAAVYLAPCAPGPLLLGVWRPKILVPEHTLDTTTLQMILHHELVHQKQGHIAAKLLAQMACCVHWYNPFVWLMSHLLRRDIELLCDDSVLHGQNDVFRTQYADSILSVLRRGKEKPLPCSTAFGSSKETLRRRFVNIFDKTTKRRGRAVLAVLTAACLFAGSLVACTQNNTSLPPKTEHETLAPTNDLPQNAMLLLSLLEAVPFSFTNTPSSSGGNWLALYYLGDGRDLSPFARNPYAEAQEMIATDSVPREYADLSLENLASTLNALEANDEMAAVFFLETHQGTYEALQLPINYALQLGFTNVSTQLVVTATEETSGSSSTLYEDMPLPQHTTLQWQGPSIPSPQILAYETLANGDLSITIPSKRSPNLERTYVLRPHIAQDVPSIYADSIQRGDTYYKFVAVSEAIASALLTQTQEVSIGTVAELLAFTQAYDADPIAYLGATVRLTADLDLTGVAFSSIGKERYPYGGDAPEPRGFNGTFDGQGHTINGFAMHNETKEYPYSQGFFGHIGPYGVVENLHFTNASLTTGWGPQQMWDVTSGILAGTSSGTIRNCHVEGIVEGGPQVGGLVGHVNGYPGTAQQGAAIVENCTADVQVRGTNEVGALCGSIYSARITNCSASGSVRALVGAQEAYSFTMPALIGGFSGLAGNAVFSGCTSDVRITYERFGTSIGAFIGDASLIEIENSTYNATKTQNLLPIHSDNLYRLNNWDAFGLAPMA